jgi:hypothetical protein
MCDDKDPCTIADKCQATTCSAGTPIVCDDCLENGACDKATGGCKGTPKRDGEPCTGGGTCQGGLCSTHPPDAGAPDARLPDAAGGGLDASVPNESGAGSVDSSLPGSEGGNDDSEEVFARDPGGCACRTTEPARSGSAWALFTLGGLTVGSRLRTKSRSRRCRSRDSGHA